MTLTELLSDAKQAVAVISNPSKSAVVAGGVAGALAVKADQLKKGILSGVEEFAAKIGPFGQNSVNDVTKYIFGNGSLNNSPAAATASSSGFPAWGLILVGGLLLVLIVRKA